MVKKSRQRTALTTRSDGDTLRVAMGTTSTSVANPLPGQRVPAVFPSA